MRQFRHLNVPEHWEHYWSKYPQGYTILEALISWVSQVDNMVDNQNNLNTTVENYGFRLDDFLGLFDTNLRNTAEETLMDWQTSGFLNLVINDALQWQLDSYITTNEQNLLSIDQQLDQKAQQSALEIEKGRINNLVANAGNTDGNAELLDIRVGLDGVVYSTAGESVRNLLTPFMTETNERWSI